MFELLDEKLVFKDSNELIYKSGIEFDDIEKLNNGLTFLLSKLIAVKYFYDFCELISDIQLFFRSIKIDLDVEIFKEDRNNLTVVDLVNDYRFLQVYSSEFEVRTYMSRPRDLYLKIVLNSCKI